MPTESPKTEGSPLPGCLVLIFLIGIGGWVGYSKYLGKSQPVVISLSAYFVDDSGNPLISSNDFNGHLKIKGQVYQSGKPLEGNVRLTVSKEDDSFQQGISLDLKGGAFESEDPAFRPLQRDDKLHVQAEISSPSLAEPASAGVYLNTATPSLSPTGTFWLWMIIGIVLVIITIGFFMTFTGKRTPEKNRNAIVFSYLFGGVFLAVPLLAPVLLLQIFPNLRQAMIGAPAGLVLTKVPPEDKVQWALNIGGYSKLVAAASPTPTPIGKASSTPTGTPGRPAAASPTPQPSQTPTTTPVPGSSPQQTQNVVAAASPRSSPQPTPTVSSQEVSKQEASKQEVSKEDVSEGVVIVEGGLVIPLYVIMLSVIGGAINMIRKVPQFQGEGEYFEPASRRPIGLWPTLKMAGTSIKGLFTGSSMPDRPAEPPVTLTAEEVHKDDGLPPAEVAPTDTQPVTGTTKEPDAKAEPAADAGRDLPAATQDSPAAEPLLDDRAKLVDAQLDKLVKDQLNRRSLTRTISAQINDKVQEMQRLFDSKSDDQCLLEFESFEAWMGSRVGLKEVLGRNWRVELLNQYMYLISAPFLAIVAYFILDLLSLTKKPILVLISFSVGLISERILTWILGLASGYLRGNSKGQAAPS